MNFLIISFVIIKILSTIRVEGERQIILELDSFHNCKNAGDLKVSVENVSLKFDQHRKYQYIDTDIHVKQNFATLSMLLTIVRCKLKEAPDTCSQFTKLKTNKVCEVLQTSSYGFNHFLECVRPKLPCPLIKGIYRARNCYFDFSKFNVFPLTGSYWKLTGEMFAGSEKVACTTSEGGLFRK